MGTQAVSWLRLVITPAEHEDRNAHRRPRKNNCYSRKLLSVYCAKIPAIFAIFRPLDTLEHKMLDFLVPLPVTYLESSFHRHFGGGLLDL